MSNFRERVHADLVHIDEFIADRQAELATAEHQFYVMITDPPKPDGSGKMLTQITNILTKAAQTVEQIESLQQDQQLVHQIARGELAPRLLRQREAALRELLGQVQALLSRINLELQAVSQSIKTAESGRNAAFDTLRRRGYSDPELNAVNSALQAEKGQ